jgi:biopolymer transport protein TolR
MSSLVKFKENSGRKHGSYRAMAEINVTPLVDVMLVLLIVFMIAAPLLTSGVPVDLPNSKANPLKEEDNKPLEITITDKANIYVGDTEVKFERLVTMLEAMTNTDPDRRVYIRGDENLSYGQVMKIIGAINKAGFRKVALISEATTNKP